MEEINGSFCSVVAVVVVIIILFLQKIKKKIEMKHNCSVLYAMHVGNFRNKIWIYSFDIIVLILLLIMKCEMHIHTHCIFILWKSYGGRKIYYYNL
jgi:hypothetical protein